MSMEVSNLIRVVGDPFSLQELSYSQPHFDENRNKHVHLVPDTVDQLLDRLHDIPEEDDRLLVIGVGTGGTISMSPTGPDGSLVPDLNLKEIVSSVDDGMHSEFNIHGFDAFSADSSQLDIDDVGDLAIAMSYTWQNMPSKLKEKFGGFMVVHGTDTMPRSGAHLAMMLGENVPFNVVHTGAQKPMGTKINDAAGNVRDSLYQLQMLAINGKAEALTVMGGLSLLTVGVTKVSDRSAQAMWSPLHQTVVEFDNLPNPDTHRLPTWLRDTPKTEAKFQPVVYRGPNRIGEIRAEMQDDPRAIDAAIRHTHRLAMILVTYGANTFDVNAIEAIDNAARSSERRIPLFAASPVNGNPDLNSYAVGEAMEAAGIQPAYMTIEALRAKIMRTMGIIHKLENVTGRRDSSKLAEYHIAADPIIGEIPTPENSRVPYES